MKKLGINLINPYLRYAKHSKYVPAYKYTCAVDYHFYYLISKSCNLEIDEKLYNIKRGTVVIIPPGVKYIFDSEEEIEIISINFDYTQNNSHIAEAVVPFDAEIFDFSDIIELAELENGILNAPLVLENMNYIEQKIDSVIYEFTYKKQFFRDVASGYFKNILLEILRSVESSHNNEIILSVIDYIHKHYQDNISNDDLARISGYHSYHLNRLMKKFTGTTLRQYIIDHRIETAKSYLMETALSVYEVSIQCGYKNFSNFSNDFKRKTGVSPSIYRNSRKTGEPSE